MNNNFIRNFLYCMGILLSLVLSPCSSAAPTTGAISVPVSDSNKDMTRVKNITGPNTTEISIQENANTETISVRGKVTFSSKKSIESNEEADVEDTIIYFEPKHKVLVEPLETPHKILMRKKTYYPRVSAVPVGSEIQISNHDTIIHNAFSPSKPNDFDMGFYGKSEGKIHRFDQPGLIRIFCNVHFHMVAYVLALDTPYFTRPDKNGFFSLDNLPKGEGQLIFWHERTESVIKKMAISQNQNVDVELEVNKRRVPEHKNKSGGSYNKKRSRRKYN